MAELPSGWLQDGRRRFSVQLRLSGKSGSEVRKGHGMLRRSIGFGLALTCIAGLGPLGLACGDDDDNKNTAKDSGTSLGGASGSTPGLPNTRPPPKGDSGTATGGDGGGVIGEGEEGAPCQATADCGQ